MSDGRMEIFDDPTSTREEILAAAYEAVCTYGYAELTIEKIGQEFDKSPSLIYRHYDGKDDLLIACLDFMLERYAEAARTETQTDPRAQMERILEEFLVTDTPPERERFLRSLVELRGQAPHNADYRAHFTRVDRLFQARFETIIEAGIEQGQFQDVAPGETASMIYTLLSGVLFRYMTSDHDEWIPDVHTYITGFLENELFR